MKRYSVFALMLFLSGSAFGEKLPLDGRELLSRGLVINEDSCSRRPTITGEGVFEFDLTQATPDGPPHTACAFAGDDQIDHDVWACWTSPCTGRVFVRTCGLTDVDTKIAVYQGCTCPKIGGNLRACNDDGCGSDTTQSLLTFNAVRGLRYLIRIGTFSDVDPGPGAVQITCGVEGCPSEGSCLEDQGGPGCEDQSCCEAVCGIDPFCCFEMWDPNCVTEAQGLCEGQFAACGIAESGDCSDPIGLGTPGCSDNECCNIVCRQDPFCCIEQWDDVCAARAAISCRRSCAVSSESCFTAHSTSGCASDACCSEVCPRDPFCCQAEWDQDCTDQALRYCR